MRINIWSFKNIVYYFELEYTTMCKTNLLKISQKDLGDYTSSDQWIDMMYQYH